MSTGPGLCSPVCGAGVQVGGEAFEGRYEGEGGGEEGEEDERFHDGGRGRDDLEWRRKVVVDEMMGRMSRMGYILLRSFRTRQFEAGRKEDRIMTRKPACFS